MTGSAEPRPEQRAASPLWEAFAAINGARRAVRDFTGEPVADGDVREILAAAQLAPSSGNLQPYELHWVRDPALRRQVALACNRQRAAATAGALVVVVARWSGVAETSKQILAAVEASALYDEREKQYHREQAQGVWVLGPSFGARTLSFVVGILFAILGSFTPHVLMAPVGRNAYQWAARNSIFAAQTILLAAVARGLAACPMEGFNPLRVAKILGLHGAVIPLVIAIGKPSPEARIEPRWRRPFEEAVIQH